MMRINLTAFPYDSEVIRYEKDGTPVYDRAVDSKVFRNIFLRYFTEGVDPNGGFTIVENSTQGALVKKGWANIRGVFIELKEDTAITFEAADSMDRIDRVILRHDDTKTVRKPDVIVLKGTPSNSPQAPNITRNETQYDIVLADVRIRANSSVVTNTQITSQRLNTDLCGIITGAIKQVNTNDLYNQIRSDLSQFKENEQTEFLEWFESIKGKLGEDLAGNLQLQIDDLDSRTGILEEATFTGEFTQIESEFSGITGDNGIEVARIEGAFKHDGTPTPEQPIEPQFFHATAFNTNGGNLFDASKLQTKSQGGATVTNNGDGSFTVGTGSLPSALGEYPSDNVDEEFDITGSDGSTLEEPIISDDIDEDFGQMPLADLNENFAISTYINSDEFKRNFKVGKLYAKEIGTKYTYPYLHFYANKKDGSRLFTLENEGQSVEITYDILKEINSFTCSVYGASGQSIKQGTIKPVLYQDGDGAFYPFNASSTPVDIELRALPNGVKDTYENGVITRRVGFVEFDGSQTAMSIAKNSDGTYRVSFQLEKYTVDKDKYFTNSLCDKATQLEGGSVTPLSSGKFIVGEFKDWGGKRVVISVPSNVSTTELAKKYFTDNPYRVWYELKKPITEPINIPILKSFYPFTNAWCDSELETKITWNALTGRSSILDGLGNLIREAPMTGPQSLTINGDFQINQRDESIYTETSYTNQYTLDMWRFSGSGSSTIEPVSDGLEVTNKGGGEAFVSQFAQFETEVGSYYAFSTKIRAIGTVQNVVARITFEDSTKKEVSLKNGINQLIFKADKKIKSYEIRSGASSNNFVINYIDLFHGNIAYEHQKEDYATALMRCQQYVLGFKKNGLTTIGYALVNGKNVIFTIPIPTTFADKPIVSSSVGMSIIIDGIASAGLNNIGVEGISSNMIQGSAELSVDWSDYRGNMARIYLTGDNPNVVFTCEPL